jgi:serine/threonine protein kinase/WD40 repeat protein
MNAKVSTPGRDPLDRLAESFLERFRRGERPNLHEYTAAYPELAEDIRELFPALVEVEQLKSAEHAPPVADLKGRLEFPKLGDYQILGLIGSGGMGHVYEAVRESLQSRVALKIMHARYRDQSSYVRRFHVEARAAARLHHTNIVSVFDYGEIDGVVYFAMPYIAGQSLDRVLDDVRRLRAESARPAGAPLARPLVAESLGGESPSPVRSDCTTGAVAQGLLTGRFASARTAAVHETPSPPGPSVTGASAIPAEVPDEPAHSTMSPGWAEPPAKAPSSSLAEQTEDRYFREVARLGAQVADALAYAHERGILHRDIKPSNLLLDAHGNLWVTDFGLAKFEEGEDLSRSQDVVGTLRYMAPERFRGVSDRRGDLYALGATLYELLTLRPAFKSHDRLRLIDQIVNEPPAPPRQLDRRIPRDLETIVLKALAKDAKDRFATADELGAELRLFLEHRPIRSRPIPAYERLWRWSRRNPALAAANLAAAVLTTILAIVSTIAAWISSDQLEALQIEQGKTQANLNRALEAERTANERLKETQKAETKGREKLFESRVSQAQARRVSRRIGQRFETLGALTHAVTIAKELNLPPEKFEPLRDEAIACLALPDLRPTGRVITRPPGVIAVVFDPTLTRYALRFKDGMIQVRQVAENTEIARFQARGDREFQILFSPNGRYLATTHYPGAALTVWDVDRRAVSLDVLDPVWPATFSPDSRRIFLVRQLKLLEFDLATGRLIRTWPGRVDRAAFRPNGAQIALTDTGSRTCRILEAESGRLVRKFPLRAVAEQVAWSPDGTMLATPCQDKIYLWDAATGTRRATLEGHINGGLSVAFHPAGALLTSVGWEGRLWLWDPVLGRHWLNVTGGRCSELSQDGRIVIQLENQWTTYQVDPALEYRTLAHVFSERTGYGHPSIRHDGRVLAVGTHRGVVLWDLARGEELGFLPIGLGWVVRFDTSGNLITSGSHGVQRWPVVLETDRGEFQIGPPQQLPLPAGTDTSDADRSGRIVALANSGFAFVATPERTFHVGPLDACQHLAVSPDREWLVTGTEGVNGAQVWRLSDATRVAQLAIDGHARFVFSPDGKWLMPTPAPCRLWAVGTWRETRQVGGEGQCFSPDGRLVVVQDANRVLRLVEAGKGLTLARLESPDLCTVAAATFSPDGSRLVVSTNDGPAVHVWDLRAIRRQLARMGLDWDAPGYSDDDPASSTLPPLPPLKVDPLTGHLVPKIYEPLIADLETALARHPDQRQIRGVLAQYCNNFAWGLVTAPGSTRDSQRALSLARRAVELAPAQGIYLNTLGVAQYRMGQYTEAAATLEKSFAAGKGESDAFDLFFMAMARFKRGEIARARVDFERAVQWRRDHPNLTQPGWNEDLDAFQAEARALLDGPPPELPADVFAPE